MEYSSSKRKNELDRILSTKSDMNWCSTHEYILSGTSYLNSRLWGLHTTTFTLQLCLLQTNNDLFLLTNKILKTQEMIEFEYLMIIFLFYHILHT